MTFENPINKKVKKLEEQLNNYNPKEKEEVNNNIISLNDILNTSNNNQIEKEMIDYPHNASIVNIPRQISLSANQIGIINIKYSNKLDDNMKKVM